MKTISLSLLFLLLLRLASAQETTHDQLLPDLLKEGMSKDRPAGVTLSGKVNMAVGEFPYKLDLLSGEELFLKKENGVPLYYMQYTKERVEKATTGVEGFEIATRFGNNQLTVEAGKPISLMVEVTVTKDASLEYVMIEVPIPGACSYFGKDQNRNQIETHREYFKDRTVIFCENMAKGKYTFEVQLLPRFTGKYKINPAQVSLIYVPVVNANTDMKEVNVTN